MIVASSRGPFSWVSNHSLMGVSNFDTVLGLYFIDCPAHRREISDMWRLRCPILNCGVVFSSEKQLKKHVSTEHTLNFCNLCLEHRPLFIQEHQLYSKEDLKRHLREPGEEDSGGHTQCLFCQSHCYDAMSLYLHMRDSHLSCFLCSAEYQYRYYRDQAALREHLSSTHFVCTFCESSNSAFSTHGQLRSHMLGIHGVQIGGFTGRQLSAGFTFRC